MTSLATLDFLIDEGIINATLGRLKSGKEADVYLVDRGEDLLVAKVYKDRAHRSFKNNVGYKEGRKTRGSRDQRAIDSGSKYGREVEEDAWKSSEADALFRLYGEGVRVPQPVIFYGGVLLMHLVRGPDGTPARRLIDVAYDRDTAKDHFLDLRQQMIKMLCGHSIHGDLSPYNILEGETGPTIIDFPQLLSAAHSSQASFYFLRDFDNVLQFFCGANSALAAHKGDGQQIWRTYQRGNLTPEFVPSPQRAPRRRSEQNSPSNGRARPSRDRKKAPAEPSRKATSPRATRPDSASRAKPAPARRRRRRRR